MIPPPDPDQTGELGFEADRDGARFRPGTLLLGRFRVVRLLGVGGMGEVYEAEDLELREAIAVKTIRLSHARDASMLDRLRKEVQLGRRVSHPNVCRLFDVFRVTLPSSADQPPVDCAIVTMELLRGRTLSEHIRDDGALPLNEALPLAQQIAEGLQAAHEAGVVHRDLKSANVFLAREESATRAVITDFGLATSLTADAGNWELSVTGAVIGTLAYMSPEQLRGEPATPRSDIYAFGIVLYEMVSGVLPFRALTPMAAALKRVNERPEDLRHHLPNISTPWYDTIHRCLAFDPEERFAQAVDVAAALTATPSWTSKPLVRWSATVAAIVAIVAGSATYVRFLKQTTTAGTTVSSPKGAPVSHARPSVALFGFKNVTQRSEFAYISTALDQGLGSELAMGEQLRIVSGEEVARIKQELALSVDTLAGDTLTRVRESLGSDLIVLGSYTALGTAGKGQLRVDFRVQDTRTGMTVAWSQDGTEADLLNLISESGAMARQKLGLAASTEVGAGTLASAKLGLPSSGDARRLYAEGLDALRRFDASLARDLFVRTIAQEPDFAMAHVALSRAWVMLGYDTQAVREAATATQLTRGLRQEEVLWIDGLHREAKREWPKAIDAFSRLVKDYPDDPEYVIRLAEVQTSGGRPRDALATIGTVRKNAAAFADDPRLWLAEASAAEALGDSRRQESAARAAIAQAQQHGARLLVARASIAQGRALQLLGNPTAAAEANETARRLADEAGDRRGVARALIQLGDLAIQSGDLRKAEDDLRTALDISRDIGNKRQTMQALNSLASVFFDLGRFVPAAEMYQEAAKVGGEIGDQNAVARAIGNLASVKYEQGDIVDALRLDEEALALRRTIGDQRSIAFSLSNMGEAAADLGRLDRAQTMYEESRTIAMELRDRGELSFALSGLATIAVRRDNLAEAQSLLEEAVRLRREIGDTDSEMDARVELAAVLVETDQRQRAAQLLTDVTASAGSDTAALAAAVRARLALDAGRTAEARAALSAVRGTGKPDYGMGTGVIVDLVDARLLSVEGKTADGVRLARSVRERMRSRQLVAFELDATLALVEIEKDRAQARQLSARATKAGFLLIARKAAMLAR